MIRTIFLALILTSIVTEADAQLEALEFRELGPYRGGRVTAVAGVASMPGTFYMGATGGGLWKTEDYGISWANISDGYFATPSIGLSLIHISEPTRPY